MQPRTGFSSLHTAVTATWVIFTLGLCGFIALLDFRRAEQDFTASSSSIYEHVANRTEVTATVLDGFASLLGIIGDSDAERQKAARYARLMLERYPQIYMFEIAGKVAFDELERFIARRRSVGPSDFEVRAFDFDGTRTWLPVADKPFYYPILFMEPMTPESVPVLGLDLDSHPLFRGALAESGWLQGAAASHPFHLVEGARGYVLHQAVVDAREAQTAGGPFRCEYLHQRYALLVIKTEGLLPAAPDPRLELLLYHAEFKPVQVEGRLTHRAARPVTTLEQWLFPRLTHVQELDSQGQPFVLQVGRQLGWHDLSGLLLGMILLVGGVSYWLAMTYATAFHRRALARLQQENRLFGLANYDPLTGLPNRNLLDDRLQHAQAQAYRQGTPLALIFVDLNEFKRVNHAFGHQGGDRVLRLVGERLRQCVRDGDTVARLGGDEFVIVLEDCDEAQAAVVVDKINEAFAAPFTLRDQELFLQISLGMSRFPADGSDIEALLRRADDNMYAHKLQRRSGVSI